jgi:hypothetical protein
MSEVVMNNESGWELRVLQEIRTCDGVLQVDGVKLLPNGRFQQMVVHLPNPQAAAFFSQSAAKALAAFSA